MHTPTLLILATLLMGLMAGVLLAVSHFNRGVPGLRAWALSYVCGFVVATQLLLRGRLPELPSVMLTQACMFWMAYGCLLGARAYMGRPRWPLWIVPAGAAVMAGMGVWFSVVFPNLGIRAALSSLLGGVFYLGSAWVVARGGWREHPSRYLMATACVVHGAFMLLRPWVFDLGTIDSIMQAAHWTAFESVLALILLAFCILMLVNEHITGELRRLAERDFLTGCFNRRAFMSQLDQACGVAQRQATALPIVVLDLDHFKTINDRHGHQLGDRALQHFVAVATLCLRKQDVMGRMGGEEFALFLPHTGPAEARLVCERLRQALAQQALHTDKELVSLTVSIGLAFCAPGETPEFALHRADEAMYRAKTAGRNQVVCGDALPS